MDIESSVGDKQQVLASLTSVDDRLIRDSARLRAACQGKWQRPVTGTPRPDQYGVLGSLANYLRNAAALVREARAVPWGRIILPSRTGKTVIEALLAGATGETLTIVVPTIPILERTLAEMMEWLPGVQVGVFYGEEKRVVKDGVNIVLYQSLAARARAGTLPQEIRDASYVLLDEGHESMTKLRQEAIENAFRPHAVRIALTATPDYDENRRLAAFFPRLIHEMFLREAIEMQLLAPFTVVNARVKLDASCVHIAGADFDREELGRVLAVSGMLEAVRIMRYYHGDHAGLPALVVCSSVEQAMANLAYLRQTKPKDTPEVLCVTRAQTLDERRQALNAFEAGNCDTLITVRMLLRGWDSARCKLIVDAAPTLSYVMTAQKLMRPLTRDGLKSARICTVYPEWLPADPVMPVDVFGASFGASERVFAPVRGGTAKPTPSDEPKNPRLYGLNVATSTGVDASNWSLNPRSVKDVRKVLESHPRFAMRHVPRLPEFAGLAFATDSFQGTGVQLLRYCGFTRRLSEYDEFIVRHLPDKAGDLYEWEKAPSQLHIKSNDLMDRGVRVESREVEERTDSFDLDSWFDDSRLAERFDAGFRLVLTERQRYVLVRRYLLDPHDEEVRNEVRTLTEVGKLMGLQQERVRQIEREAMMRVREQTGRKGYYDDDSAYGGDQKCSFLGHHRELPVYITGKHYLASYPTRAVARSGTIQIGNRKFTIERPFTIKMESSCTVFGCWATEWFAEYPFITPSTSITSDEEGWMYWSISFSDLTARGS